MLYLSETYLAWRLGTKLRYAGLSSWWSSEETLDAVAGQNSAPVGMF